MTEMVGADLAFEAVGGPCQRGGHDAGVVDQDVDLVDPVCELAHRRQILQVELTHLDRAGFGAGHLLGGGLAFAYGADGQDHPGAAAGQLAGRHRSQPTVGPGNDGGATGERGEIGGCPGCHAPQH